MSTEQIASLPRMGDDSKLAPEMMEVGDGKEALGGGKEVQEKRIYDDLHKYSTKNTYSTSATKAEKATVHRRAKNFQVLDGILYYTGRDAKKQVAKQIYLAIGPQELV